MLHWDPLGDEEVSEGVVDGEEGELEYLGEEPTELATFLSGVITGSLTSGLVLGDSLSVRAKLAICAARDLVLLLVTGL